ncbi:hypothetical protein [Gluconacetobacter entanii]|nr:hypothetical protein [Gluconacetobacter entanii]
MTTTPSSMPRTWRAFALTLLAVGLSGVGVVFAFIAGMDAWNVLPVHLPLSRVPTGGNARYTMGALARDGRFDAAMLGTSTARLIRPDMMGPLFGAHFVNLAMNNATAWEQDRLLEVFMQAHSAPRVVMLDLDHVWCLSGDDAARGPHEQWTEWVYSAPPWQRYGHMLDLYALQEAANQALYQLGLKADHAGADGYQSFVPDDATYDRARVSANFALWLSATPVASPTARVAAAPSLALLPRLLARIPADTLKIVWFPPVAREMKQHAGPARAMAIAQCRARIVADMDHVPNAIVVDFDIPGPIADVRDSFWDPLHYRTGVAARITRDLARAVHDPERPAGEYVVRVAHLSPQVRDMARPPS